MLNLFLPQLRLDSQAVKLQYNEGLLLPLTGWFHFIPPSQPQTLAPY